MRLLRTSTAVVAAATAVAGLALLAALATSALALAGHLATRRVDTPRGTLDGLAYRHRYRPAEAAAFEWIERNVAGLPVIVEAFGPPYRDYARFASNTGLPTLVGWDYHLTQRGRSPEETAGREVDVARIYAPISLGDVRDLLVRHGALLVVSGAEEREAHGTAHEPLFRALPGLLEPVFAEGDVTLYRFSFTGRYRRDHLDPAPLPDAGVTGRP